MLFKQRLVDLLDGLAGLAKVQNELLEERSGETQGDVGQRRELLRGVLGVLHNGLADLFHALGAHGGKIHACGDAPEGGLRADVFLGLVAQVAEGRAVIRNVGEGIFALGVGAADTEETGGEFENVGRVVHRGHEAGLAAAVVHVDAERLQVAADDVRAVAVGHGHNAEGDGVHADDALRARVMRGVRDLARADLQTAEVVGVFEVDNADRIVQLALQVGKIDAAGLVVALDLLDLEVGRAVVLHDRELFAVHGAGHEHAGAPRDAGTHADGGGSSLGVVHRRDVDHFHVEQLSHHALILEEGLEAAEVVVALAAVSGEELALAVDLVADGGDIVLIAARAEEVEVVRAGAVLLEQLLHVAAQLVLGAERLGQVHVFFQNDLVGHFLVQLFERGQANFMQHLLFHFGNGVGDVRMALESFHTHYSRPFCLYQNRVSKLRRCRRRPRRAQRR